MDQMPTEERIALINDAVNYMVGSTDPESQKTLQTHADAVIEDANSPAKFDEAHKVSPSESDNDIDIDR